MPCSLARNKRHWPRNSHIHGHQTPITLPLHCGPVREALRPDRGATSLSQCSASITFLEADTSTLQGADHAAALVTQLVTSLDVLYMSPGYLAFGGPHCE